MMMFFGQGKPPIITHIDINTDISYKSTEHIDMIYSQSKPLKFGNGYEISCHNLLGMWSLTYAGLQVDLYQ